VAALADRGLEVVITQGVRSAAQQRALYAQGRTRPGKIVTNCDGYIKKSPHQHWLAIDIAIVKNGAVEWADLPEYHDLGEYWESLGGFWGGRIASLGDVYHFELKE
jgi:peptidoglycan L-alanyl-D-glutamate endopeptidase CwlK